MITSSLNQCFSFNNLKIEKQKFSNHLKFILREYICNKCDNKNFEYNKNSEQCQECQECFIINSFIDTFIFQIDSLELLEARKKYIEDKLNHNYSYGNFYNTLKIPKFWIYLIVPEKYNFNFNRDQERLKDLSKYIKTGIDPTIMSFSSPYFSNLYFDNTYKLHEFYRHHIIEKILCNFTPKEDNNLIHPEVLSYIKDIAKDPFLLISFQDINEKFSLNKFLILEFENFINLNNDDHYYHYIRELSSDIQDINYTNKEYIILTEHTNFKLNHFKDIANVFNIKLINNEKNSIKIEVDIFKLCLFLLTSCLL